MQHLCVGPWESRIRLVCKPASSPQLEVILLMLSSFRASPSQCRRPELDSRRRRRLTSLFTSVALRVRVCARAVCSLSSSVWGCRLIRCLFYINLVTGTKLRKGLSGLLSPTSLLELANLGAPGFKPDRCGDSLVHSDLGVQRACTIPFVQKFCRDLTGLPW